jgi:AraC-like DNA-binding protein
MQAQLGEPLSLQVLARIAFLSTHHFVRVFRQITGLPPMHFLYALRLQEAKRLILTTRLSITEICYTVGYNSLGTFVTRFTSLVGLSPGQLRRMAENPSAFCSDLPTAVCDSPTEEGDSMAVLHGRVSSCEPTQSPIFVGLFPTVLPQGRPTAYTLVHSPGFYAVVGVPDGVYFVFSVCCPRYGNVCARALYEGALRGHAGPVLVRKGQVSGNGDITLRSGGMTDPPVLIHLPALFSPGASLRPQPAVARNRLAAAGVGDTAAPIRSP